MKNAMNKEIIVMDSLYDDRPSEELIDFIAWCQEKIDSIPEAYRSTAIIDITGINGYEGPEAHIKIAYTRPETEIEILAREAGERKVKP